MPWVDLLPGSGADATECGVTVGWRAVRPHKFRLSVNVAKAMMRRLDWTGGGMMRARLDLEAGALLIEAFPEGRARVDAYTLYEKEKTGIILLPMPYDLGESTRPARPVEFSLAGNKGLTVTLPDWAAPERVAAKKRAEDEARAREGGLRAAEQARARMLQPHRPPGGNTFRAG